MNKTQINDIAIHRFFMKSHIWNFKEYPDTEVQQHFSRKKNTILDLTAIKNTPLFEEIRDIFVCIFVNKEPCSYKTKAFPSFMFLADFMYSHGYNSFEEITDCEKTTAEWLQYWTNKGKKYLHDYSQVITNSIFILQEFRDSRIGLDRNYWRLEDMCINSERIDKTCQRGIINFWKISNEENRELTKQWFKHLIGGTELSYATIINRYTMMYLFVDYLKEKSILDVTHKDIEEYRLYKKFSADRNNHFINAVSQFYKFLKVKKIFSGEIPILESDRMDEKYTFISNTVSQDIILQLFKHIHELPEDYLLIFLIDLFTGIRISDICQLEPNCILKNENGYFIFHDVQKMQDVGGIPISKELYLLIKKRISYIKNLDYKEKYLFPSVRTKNRPYVSCTYRNKMKKYVQKWGIKRDDGNEYNFVTHAFRHTIATELYRLGMSSTMIQLGILHHKEIQMSLKYIEIDAETQKLARKSKAVNAKSSIENDVITDDCTALPNGFCSMPQKLHCPNMNACLTCQFFRTSIEFLDVHKQYLESLKERIKNYESNGYTQNLSFALEEKKHLELIISKLEEIGEEKYDTNCTKTTK